MDSLKITIFVCLSMSTVELTTAEMNSRVSCGQTSFSGSSGTIKSPRYPNKYPAGKTCTYNIRVSYGKRIELEWQSFDINGDMPDCSDDYVEVFVGCDVNRLSKFCTRNAAQPHKIYTIDHCLKLVFHSTSGSKSGNGFSATYETKSTSEPVKPSYSSCSKKWLYSKSGVLYSPQYPHETPHLHRDCEWKIKVDSDYVIKLNMMDIDTKKFLYCSDSFSTRLKVEGEKSKVAPENKRYFCGSMKPTYLKAKYYELEIEFEQGSLSSGRTDKRGIMVGYIAYKYNYGSPLSKAAIAGIIIATVVVFGCCLFFVCRRVKRRREASRSSASYSAAPKEPVTYPPKGPSYGTAAPPPPPSYNEALNQPAGYQGYAPYQPPPPGAAPYPTSGPAPYLPTASYPPSGLAPYPTGPPPPGTDYPPTSATYPPPSGAPYPPVSSESQKASAPPYP